jgi:hypothetical protein
MEKFRKEVELAFWKAAIPLLTRSAVLRGMVRNGTAALQDKKAVRNLGILLIACCLGFAFGMLVFSVYSLVI